jgi:hypothetical protein
MLDLIGLVTAVAIACAGSDGACSPGVATSLKSVQVAQLAEPPVVAPAPASKPVVKAKPKILAAVEQKPERRVRTVYKRRIEVPIIIGGYF